MAIFEQPALETWTLRPWKSGLSDVVRAARERLFHDVNENARRLGTAAVESPQWDRVIGTGHQAWFWHPGILAKDVRSWKIAAHSHAPASVVHVVVDHDVHPALSIELPVVRDQQLSLHVLKLGEELPEVPSGCHPPVRAENVTRAVEGAIAELGASLPRDVATGLTRLAIAFRVTEKRNAPATLAQQVTAVTWALSGGAAWAANIGVVFGTELHKQPVFQAFVETLTRDALNAATQYNKAVEQFPTAGIGVLKIESGRVELPLWWLEWEKPRRRVFANISNGNAELVSEDGVRLNARATDHAGFLAPRALTLTACFRAWLSDGFVHGKGGGVYDRVTEAWWDLWGAKATGIALAPMAVASADLRMKFNVPVADRDERLQAIWRKRWLSYNVDLALDEPHDQKHELVQEMERIEPGSNLGRQERREIRARNAKRFQEIRNIVESLRVEHPEIEQAAQKEIDRTTIGESNRAAALKRDWFWAIYPPRDLAALQ